MLFVKIENGFIELFEVFLEEILLRDFIMISSYVLVEFVWFFVKKEMEVDELFDRVEEEILKRGIVDLNKISFIIKVFWVFGKVGKGSK